jgi:hypothetical protein
VVFFYTHTPESIMSKKAAKKKDADSGGIAIKPDRPDGVRGIEGFGWVHKSDLVSRKNPLNWRKHPKRQRESLETVMADPEVGWAGVLLLNLSSGKLIDGHLRTEIDLSAANLPDWLPVCYGHWSDAAERKILLTLDPIAALATEDAQMLKALSDSVSAQIADTLGSLEEAEQNPVWTLVRELENEATILGGGDVDFDDLAYDYHDMTNEELTDPTEINRQEANRMHRCPTCDGLMTKEKYSRLAAAESRNSTENTS